MPAGVEVFIEDGYATVGVPDRDQRAEVFKAIMEHTPAKFVEKLTRTGGYVHWRIPEGNAAAAGLLEDSYIKDRFQSDRLDNGRAEALAVGADPQAPQNQWPGDYHTITPNVADMAYAAGRSTVGPVQDGDVNSGEATDQDATISGPLRPNKPVVDAEDVPVKPPFASETSAELQKRIRESTINPVDYEPERVPLTERVPSAQGTIAAVVDRKPVEETNELPAGVGFTGEFPDTDQGTADETPLSPPVPNDTHLDKPAYLDASDYPRVLTPDENDQPTSGWTIPDLKQYAKDHDIDLEGATKKADILAKVLKKA